MLVVLTLPTLDRPQLLGEALASIQALDVPPHIDLEIIVIDNSLDGAQASALRLDNDVGEKRFVLHAVHEKRQGISAARNAGIETALALHADIIGFTDDDQALEPDWLLHMLKTRHTSGAEAVVSRFEPRARCVLPWWVLAAHEIDRQDALDGSLINFGYTCGSMVDAHFIVREGLRFDDAFGISGGEDTDFFERLLSVGGRIGFARQAVGYEAYDGARCTLRWWLRRWFRDGNSSGARLASYEEHNKFRVLVQQCWMGAVRVGVGVPMACVLAPLALRGNALPLRALRAACRGAGYLASAANYRFDEYSSARIRRERPNVAP